VWRRQSGLRRGTSGVSAYASAHPWEDWADLGALSAFRGHARDGQRVWVRVQPRVSRDETLAAEIGPDPYRTDGMQEIVDAWLPLTFAVDSLNRAMGNHDLDPFVFRLP